MPRPGAAPAVRSFSSSTSPSGPSSSGRVRASVSCRRAALVISVLPSASSSTTISVSCVVSACCVAASSPLRAVALTSKVPVACR